MSDTIRIGLLADSADPYWVEVRETIWQLASRRHDDVAWTGNWPICTNVELVDIEFIVDVHDYTAKVEEILTLELSALIAVPFAMPLLYQLLDNDLPIISLHERPVDHPRFSRPRSLYQSGRLACEYLAQRIGGAGKVLILGGRVGATRASYSSRLQAAYDVFARHPSISVVHLPAPWDRAGALDAMHAALAAMKGTNPPLAQSGFAPFSDLPVAANGPFRGVFGLSDTLALVGREVGQQQGMLAPDAVVVGVNGDPLAIAAIARGEMAATVATSAAHLATEALRLACLAAAGAPLPAEFDYCPQLVTTENVAEVALAKLVAIADVPSRLVGVNRRQEERRLIQLQTSLEINRRIGAILDGETLMREISELIRTNYGYDHVQVFLWDDATQTLVRHLPAPQPTSPSRWPLAEAGMLGRALLSRRPVYVPDLQRAPAAALGKASPATRTRVAAPIRLGGKILGVLDVHSNAVRRHAQADLDALQALADELGIAMRNAQLYAEALSARAEAERANHLKTRLLANVSHELRTPLNVILGYSQAALNETNPPRAIMSDDLVDDMQQIARSGQHLVRLIDDLLNLSLAEIGALEIVPEALDPLLLITNVFNGMAGCRQHETVAWRLELPAHLPVLHADPLRLRQVLLNLLNNAEKHTLAGHITLRAADCEGWLHIWIEDTGRGIVRTQQQHLNAALTLWEDDEADLDSRRFGAGLGLRVAQHIVQLHAGRLHLESRSGHGTICHVELPLAPPVTVPEPPELPVSEMLGPDAQERMLDQVLQHTSGLPQRIAQYIVTHYATNLTREEIAAAMQVSDDYVSRTFRKATGMTPWQFLNRYRVLQAQKLLLTTQHNITEVAALTGFNDPAYFVRMFHRETGQSPQQYRKSAK